ncbi:MAG: N-6 DNA methylase [Microcella pacifica]
MSLALQRPAESPPLPSAIVGKIPSGTDSVSTGKVNSAIQALLGNSRASTQRNWVKGVGRLVLDLRPDIGEQLVRHLQTTPMDIGTPLAGMSIGEIGVVYEALLALTDRDSRKGQGQYFTPDDVASYMAGQAERFPAGIWLDPCCGVGNLSWHLANATPDADDFVANRLTLIDLDATALKTAQALLVASFAAWDDFSALPKLVKRSQRRNYLGAAPLPRHDFVIVNPPYASTARDARFHTADARELYAYFLERVVAESQGFIAITPASYLGAAKYAALRSVLEQRKGGEVIVFDNVPDTCFRGYKYGSKNTSKTNFVRAAITTSAPGDRRWQVTPILRWANRSRAHMWQSAREFLVPMRNGPTGEWVKVMPGTEEVWDALQSSSKRLRDFTSPRPTLFALDVASTPRYYISASKRRLDRGSKHTLYFQTESDMNRAYVLLNSSLPYWWWRCLDGGITLSARHLLSLPVPSSLKASKSLVERLEQSESENLVTKLNAGRQNENVRRPRALVDDIDMHLLKGLSFTFEQVYSPDMFESRRLGVVGSF